MAISRMQLLKARLPEWVQDWLEVIIPGSQILLILVVAWLLQRTLRRLVRRASARRQCSGTGRRQSASSSNSRPACNIIRASGGARSVRS